MSIVLVVVVVVTGLFAYYQEYKSSKIMESFARLAPPTTMVCYQFILSVCNTLN